MTKNWEITKPMANGYSSDSARWELSNEYQHDKFLDDFFDFFAHWTKVTSAAEVLKRRFCHSSHSQTCLRDHLFKKTSSKIPPYEVHLICVKDLHRPVSDDFLYQVVKDDCHNQLHKLTTSKWIQPNLYKRRPATQDHLLQSFVPKVPAKNFIFHLFVRSNRFDYICLTA